MSKLIIGINDLKTTHPDLCKEWHSTRNGTFSPELITAGSHRKVWWQCSEGHEWESIISNRSRLGRKCPYCTHQKILPGVTDLASVNPKLAREWHPIKNGELEPYNVSPFSKKKVWWLCEKQHEWQAEIKSRQYGCGCPYCADYGPASKVIIGENDLTTTHPTIAAEWHPTKNGNLKPQDFSYGSGKKAWWQCKNGHAYLKTIHNKVKGQGCPVCGKRRRTSFPEQAIYYYLKQAFPDAINSYRDIFKSSMELDIYIPSLRVGIEYDGKAYHSSDNNIVRDAKKYQICKSNGIILIRIIEMTKPNLVINSDHRIMIPRGSDEYIDYVVKRLLYHLRAKKHVDVYTKRDRIQILGTLEAIDKSLLSEYPNVAAEWHPEKNGNLTPNMIHPGSNEKVWWRCRKCNYEWRTSIVERTGPDKTGCPQCAAGLGVKKRKQTLIQQKGSLVETNPELIEEWDWEKNIGVAPDQITAGSGRKIWWKCANNHEWQSTINHRVKGRKCPYCTNRRIIPGYNDFASKYPELVKEWDYQKNKNLDPTKIAPHSEKKHGGYVRNVGINGNPL